jgi:carbon-monoxide dehydrogenase small subunit
MKLELTLNGVPRTLEVAPDALLLDVLRDVAGCRSVKRGCEAGDCGACTVLVDGRPLASCMLLAGQVAGRSLTTVEGLGTPERPHPLMTALVEAGAVQCGFCIPGVILSAKALLDENPNPTAEDVKAALDGHLCRCTGYVKQIEAVLAAAARLRAGKEGAR